MTALVRLKNKYTFDLATGHYRRIFEDDQSSTDNNGEQTAQAKNVVLPLLQTNEVLEMQNTMTKELQKFDDDLKRFNDEKLLIENLIASGTLDFNSSNTDAKETIRTNIIDNNKKLLQLMQQIAQKEKDKADKKFEYQSKIIQMQLQLNENNYRVLPAKYRNLNESSVHKAKIYMGDLVSNDDNHIIKGMTDFKHTFADRELLYGKDKDGFYVICIDLEDFLKMYDTLEETGYLKDDIIATVMPQVFDRNEMTK